MGRLSFVIAGDAWRRARPALLRSLVFVTLPVTWPLWKLARAWIRRDPQVAAGFHDLEAAKNSRELGPYHRATLRAQAGHAVALSKLGELQQAEAELTEVIIRLNPLDDGDARLLLDVRRWHHHILAKLGWVSESEADARFAAEWYARQLGPDHPDTLQWRQLTAVALWDIGRHDEAIAEMAEVAARRAATQGASHPDTLQAERTLSSMTNDENARFGLKPPAE
jgi:tetratricopeptide (TPR) repeat protein